MEKAPLIDASDDPRMVGESSSAGARAASIDRSVLSVFGGRRTPDAASGDADDKAADAGAVAASPPPPKSGGGFGGGEQEWGQRTRGGREAGGEGKKA